MRVVLDPSGMGIDLLEFLLGHGTDGALAIEENRAGAGGALVESEDVRHESLLSALVKHGAPARSKPRRGCEPGDPYGG